MPKQSINGFYSFDDKHLAVDVGWGRDADVQIGTVDRDAEQYSPEAGWFVNLDRRGINELIRVLRKARDQAYGKDE